MSVSGSKLTTAIALDFERILKDWQAFLTKFLIHFGSKKVILCGKIQTVVERVPTVSCNCPEEKYLTDTKREKST